MIKHIMPLIFIGLLVIGCDDKDSTTAPTTDAEDPAYDPSALNELQQDIIEIVQVSGASRSDDVWSELAGNIGDALALGIPCAVDPFVCGLARTAATDALSDHIGEVVASVKANMASQSLDQLKAAMDDLDDHEMIHSAAYQTLKGQLADVFTEAHTNYTGTVNHYHDLQDADIRSLETTALNTLSRSEYNTFIAHSQPILHSHAMFESGIWDDLSLAYAGAGREQVIAACVVIIALSCACVPAIMASQEAFSRSDASSLLAFDPTILNAALSTGVSVTQTQLHHAANVVGFAGGLLELVENHAEIPMN